MGCSLCSKSLTDEPNSSKTNDIKKEYYEKVYSSNCFPENINVPITILDNITVNPLGYALCTGNLEFFKLLKDQKGASIEKMELIFEKQNISSLEIVITKGFLNILEYYLPSVLLYYKDTEYLMKPLIVKAIELENLEIVKFIYKYFYCVSPSPSFDIHYINPLTGENPALVACKSCNLQMIKFLNETCEADFSLVNLEGNNALHIALLSATRNVHNSEAIKYLITSCKIDISYDYEKVFANINDSETIQLIEKELEARFSVKITRAQVLANMKESQERHEHKLRFISEEDAIVTAISSISLIESDEFSISILSDDDIDDI